MTGLVGWWPLNEDSGSTAYDLSGNENHGTLNGGVTQGVAGKAGLTSYSFDGSDQYVAPNSNVGLSTDSDFTFSTWVKFDSSADGRDRIIGLYDGSDDILFFGIENSSNEYPEDKLHVRLGHTGGNQIDDTGIGPKIRDDNWHHIVICWKSAIEELSVYIDNNLEYSKSSAIDDPFDDSETFDIGRRSDNSQYLAGEIVDVRIYDRALTPEEVQELYEMGSGDYTRPLNDNNSSSAVSRWAFDGDATDSWGGNDGSVNGATYVSEGGIRNGAYSFDGDDNISTDLDRSVEHFTFAFWINADSFDGFNDSRAAGTDSGSYQGWSFPLDTDNTIIFALGNGSSLIQIKSKELNKENWYHVAGVYDSANDNAELYVNGVSQGSKSVSLSDGGSLDLGEAGNGFAYYNGILDEIRYYNKILSPSEVFELYRWGTRGRDLRKQLVNQR